MIFGHRFLGVAALAAMLILSAGGFSTAREVPFGPVETFGGAGVEYGGLDSADLDGDGDLDIVTGWSSTALDSGWWENTGGAPSGWAFHSLAGVVSSPRLVPVDMDGDGDVDLLGGITDLSGEVRWYENANGDASLWISHLISDAFPGLPVLSPKDVDRDGDMDVFLGGAADGMFWLEANPSGAGTWSAHAIAPAPLQNPAFYASGDIDGDGTPDIVTQTAATGNIVWFANAGTALWTQHAVGGPVMSGLSIRVCDMDGDGDMDIVAPGNALNGDISWWDNLAGDGSAWTRRSIESPGGIGLTGDILSRDMDGDGDTDLVSLQAQAGGLSLKWHENSNKVATSWQTHLALNPSSSLASPLVSAADIDGDGDQDILFPSTPEAQPSLVRNLTIHHNATFPAQSVLLDTGQTPMYVSAADMDGDGDLDALAALHDDHLIVWFENTDGLGTFGPARTVSNVPQGPSCVLAADLDGDGDLDVLAASRLDGDTSWFENTDGLGTFGPRQMINSGTNQTYSSCVGDVDNDGDLDVIVVNGHPTTGFVAWHENTDGLGTFGPQQTIASSLGEPYEVQAADLDQDGNMDVILTCSYSDEVIWFRNLGGGSFDPTKHSVGGTLDYPKRVRVADIDGDGKCDVVTGSANDFTVNWYPGDGAGNFGAGQPVAPAGEATPEALAIADMDGDGDMDVVANGVGGRFYWIPNLGGGTFGPARQVTSAVESLSALAVGDMDRDGLPDILSASFGASDKVAWYRNRGGQFGVDAFDTAPATLKENLSAAVLKLNLRHNGRTGDTPIEAVRFEFLFEESPGDALTAAEANALIENVKLYADDGSGVWESAADTLAAQVDTLAWNPSGTQTVSLPDGAAEARCDYGTSRAYFLVVTLTSTASHESVTQFRVTHIANPDGAYPIMAAEDRDHDIALFAEYATDVASSIVVAEANQPAAPSMLPEPPATSGTANTVVWALSHQATNYIVECSSDPLFASVLYSANVASPTLTHTFSPLDDGVYYYFRVRAEDSYGGLSDWSNIVHSLQDATAPAGTVDINGGDPYTNTRNVALTVNALDQNPSSSLDPNPSTAGVADMRFRNDGDIDWSAWAPYQTSYAWTLRDLDGLRTVFAQFRDGAGNISAGNDFDNIILDRVEPAVTVEQAAGQIDPTQTVPIFFTVTFSEPVSGFSAADIAMGGTAGASATWALDALSGSLYRIRVTAVGRSGTLIPTVPAGAAFDVAGNGNSASTSVDNQVTYHVDISIVSPSGTPAGYYGYSVAGIGDVNGDDHGDAVVGAYREANLSASVGRVYVHDGDNGDLLYAIDSPRQAGDGAFGYAVASVPDVDGDSIDEIIVGAYRQQAFLKSESGMVYLFSGATGTLLYTFTSPNDQSFGYFGFSVAGVPSVFGTGLSGVAIGAPGENPDQSPQRAGRAYLFYQTTPNAWASITIQSSQDIAEGLFGYSIAGIELIDGTTGGVVVGAAGENVAYQFIPSRAMTLSGKPRLQPIETAAFGCSVAGVPDVDGDGRGDVVVGARAWFDEGGPIYSGRAFIFNGFNRNLILELKSPNEQAYGHFGHAVGGMGDVNGNGRGDVIVGAMSEQSGGIGFAGKAYVFDGATGALLRSYDSPNRQYDGRYGCSVAGIPGPGWDGMYDVVVGAFNERGSAGQQGGGRAYIQALITDPAPWLTRVRSWELYK